MKLSLILEMIVKPSKKDKEAYKKTGRNGKLYYVVKSEKGKNLGFIDDAYVKKINAKNPKHAAHIRFAQVHAFKERGK